MPAVLDPTTVRAAELAARPASVTPERTIHRSVRDDGICILTFDRPGSSANIFDLRTLSELAQELDFLERQPQLGGLVLASAKPAIFIAGADLHTLGEST